MVVFVCDKCGTSLKKNAVEKHQFQRCGSIKYSCIDCGKDFCGDSYKKHTSCISEDQKYGSSDFVSKEGKGKKKQEDFMTKFREYIDGANDFDFSLMKVLNKIATLDNIPKKEAKFRNFIQNYIKRDESMVKKVWGVVQKIIESCKPAAPQPTLNGHKNTIDQNITNEKSIVNGISEKKTSNKRQNDDDSDDVQVQPKKKTKVSTDISTSKEFKWKVSIKNAIKNETSDKGVKIKKLEKELVATYLSDEENELTEQEAKLLFQSKIKNDKFEICGKYIKLK